MAHNSNVTGPKVAHISNVSPKVASNVKSNNNSKGTKLPETTLLKLSQSAGAQHLSPTGEISDSDSSSSEPTFKTPRTPKPRRAVSQSPVGGCSRSPLASPSSHRGIPRWLVIVGPDTLKPVQDPNLFHYGSVHNFPQRQWPL